MNRHYFTRLSEENLIVIPCHIEQNPISLALDTGASHTTIDLSVLLIAGHEVSQAIGREKIETASGVVDAYIFIIKSFECLGIHKTNFKICAYDFFAYHYLLDFEGVIGLDFFKETKFCIDLKQNEISLMV